MKRDRLISLLGWVIAIGAVLAAFYIWQSLPVASAQSPPIAGTPTAAPTATRPPARVSLPALVDGRPGGSAADSHSLSPQASLYTVIPNRPSNEIVLHTVQAGDSVFGIAKTYGITPETVLWANFELLDDNPDLLEQGMELNIPPVNGVYYRWQEGDTLEGVAAAFEAEMDEIIGFSGNSFDLSNPDAIPAGTFVMLPGGHREFRQWLIPTIARGSAGVNTTALGPGACSGSYEGLFGSGAFIWPASRHFLSGNDYWSGHLGIDIAAGPGEPVFASDAGVVVFSGWANGGYGNTVMIDHGNGYQTLYAHLSGTSVPCGASVTAGRTVGTAGSTGNSTGSHLHFEVRLNGGFINPWFVLPAP